ncbi:hypothetical protein [Scopulibacillus daqui]|nr:hypothetical protein [Scopulibacillus daqui]
MNRFFAYVQWLQKAAPWANVHVTGCMMYLLEKDCLSVFKLCF